MWTVAEALGFFLAAGMIAYAVQRDLRTGESGDSMYHYNASENPLGYPMMIAVKIFAVVFFMAEALHAIHWIGEPMTLARGLWQWMVSSA